MIRLQVHDMDGQESVKSVTDLLNSLHFKSFKVEPGCIELLDNENPQKISHMGTKLLNLGYQLSYDHKSIIVHRTANVVKEMINNWENHPNIKFSIYLSNKMNLNYNYLSNLFTEHNGINLRQFIINMKIETVKKLLLCSGMNLTEIADMLNYSSVAHLSSQFRKTTGLSPSQFKSINGRRDIAGDGWIERPETKSSFGIGVLNGSKVH